MLYSSRISGRFGVGAVMMAMVVCCCLAALPSTANGALAFPINPVSAPDVFSDFLMASYDATSGSLTVSGTYCQESYKHPDNTFSDIEMDDVNLLSISATLTPSLDTPMNVSNGAITISGTVDGGPSGVLLTGIVDRVGSEREGSYDAQFDFVFHLTGGLLVSDYGGVGATACTALDLFGDANGDQVFTGSFEDSFSYSALDNWADTRVAPVPEPASAALVLVSMVMGLAASVWRRSGTRRG